MAKELFFTHPKWNLLSECVLHHGGSFIDENNPIEVKILQCADGLSFYYDEKRIQESIEKGKLEKRISKTMKKASVLPEGKKKAEEQLKKINY